MIFWILVGVVIGYVFKPQIDKLIFAVLKLFRGRGDR
jgi:hypothetical protein